MTKRALAGFGSLLLVLPLAVLLAGGADRVPAEKWAARYNGPANGDDSAAAMALDAMGNIYVAGTSAGSGTGTDIVVVKFDADSNQLWAQRHDGPVHGDDAAKDIAVDAAGNVFVVGTTKSAKGTDITTIKYSAAGKRIWVRTYDGKAHRDDYAGGIAVDGEGSAIVCGTGGDTGDIYFTLMKYGAKGARLWIKTGLLAAYDSGGAQDVAVDASNNIYVCGYFFVGGQRDAATVKYDKNGVRIWAKFYDGPGKETDFGNAIAVMPSGTVYVGGDTERAMVNRDYLTIKYNKNGGKLWAKTYNGPGQGDDGVFGLAVDALGNACVTGWVSVSSSNTDFATIKYGPSGRVLWTKTYDMNGDNDTGRAVVLDRAGNAYVAGDGRNSRANHDIVTLKYDRAGNLVWTGIYDGPGASEDAPNALVMNAAGALYVAGTSAGIGTGSDIVVIKYE